jgi:2'-5' RNA ligase
VNEIDTLALVGALDIKRVEQGLTWTELGEAIGTHPATFSRLKVGRAPGEATLTKILEWLGESLEAFVVDCGCDDCPDCGEHATETPATPAPVAASMIAALPSASSLEELGIEFTEELPHVTLSFLGSGDEMPEAATSVFESINVEGPIEVTIAGFGALGGEDPPATVLFLNGGDLAALRELAQVNGQPEQHEPFIAHITIGYGVSMEGLEDLRGSTIVLDRVALVGEANTILAEREFGPKPKDDDDEKAVTAGTLIADITDATMEHDSDDPNHDHGDNVIVFEDLEAAANKEFADDNVAAIYGWGRLSISENPEVVALVARAAELLEEGAVGVSIKHDLNDDDMPDPEVIEQLEREERWDEIEELFDSIRARPRHVAIVDTPAFSDAKLSLTRGENGELLVEGPIVFEGRWTGDLRQLPYGVLTWDDELLPIPIIFDINDGDHTGTTIGFIDRLERQDGVTSALRPLPVTEEAVTAAASMVSLDRLPAKHFAKFDTSKPFPVRVSDRDPATGLRHFYGLVAPRGVCHRSDMGKCFTFPGDVDREMAGFHTGAETTLDDGTKIRLGAVTMGGLHIDTSLGRRVGWKEINRHREDTNQIVAAVRAWEDRHGCWVSGVLMPDMDRPDVLMRIAAAGPSVELWPRGAGRTLVGVHLVPTPAWPVAASAGSSVHLASGSVEVENLPEALVSSTGNSALGTMTINVRADTSELERQIHEAYDGKGDPRIATLLEKVSAMESALSVLLAAHLSSDLDLDLDLED